MKLLDGKMEEYLWNIELNDSTEQQQITIKESIGEWSFIKMKTIIKENYSEIK